ncbi:gamma-glutamylcyclotransferase [Fictibacillus sp. Mic-4]|uniref:gamma-glutamylcyclotransferase family protein n=1 Tax=Fictibacillus TaxID=1329200 RepID=UPI00040585DA|nr:gamma-glutamylcyclotransferase [Fictibacillus gelatini]
MVFNVFVYGTLRKGEKYHHYLKTAKRLEENCWTYGKLYDTGCGYPAMIIDRVQKVVGEVYEVDGPTLKALDQLEGYNQTGEEERYDRIIQTIYTEKGSIEAFVYVMKEGQVMRERFILDGDWVTYRKQKTSGKYV